MKQPVLQIEGWISKYFVLLQSSKRYGRPMTETNRIEFKRELTRDLDIEREVVAFHNYHEGGVVYIGIDDDETPVGVKDIDGDMLKIKDRIRMGV